MKKLTFSELPWIARVAVASGFLTTWVEFEDQIIERQHWDVFLPYYRVGNFCVYDAVFITLLLVLLIALSRGRAA